LCQKQESCKGEETHTATAAVFSLKIVRKKKICTLRKSEDAVNVGADVLRSREAEAESDQIPFFKVPKRTYSVAYVYKHMYTYLVDKKYLDMLFLKSKGSFF
jgi:hypothetical protein